MVHQTSNSKSACIVLVGGVVMDDVTVIDGNIPAPANKYKHGAAVTLNDGREVLSQDILSLPDLPLITERLQIFGGGGYNSAVALAALNTIYGFGNIEITLVTKLGSGLNSQKAREDLEHRGIRVLDMIEESDFDIPVNQVLQGDDDRLFILNSQNYPALQPSKLENLVELTQQTHLMHVHTRLDDIANQAAKLAHASGKPLVMDASNYDADVFNRILPLVDYAILPDELKIGVPHSINPATAILDMMRHHKVPVGAVMCGGKPTLFYEGQSKTYEIQVTVSDNFQVVDKIGRGDIARAAMCLAMINAQNARKAIEFAMAVATYACTMRGMDWTKALENNPRDLERTRPGYKVPSMLLPPRPSQDLNPALAL